MLKNTLKHFKTFSFCISLTSLHPLHSCSPPASNFRMNKTGVIVNLSWTFFGTWPAYRHSLAVPLHPRFQPFSSSSSLEAS